MSRISLKWVPIVNTALCTGCGRCVEACGPNSLEVVNGIAVLVRPDTCGSEEHCIGPCQAGALQMGWMEWVGDKNRGRWGRAARSPRAGTAEAACRPSSGSRRRLPLKTEGLDVQ